MNDEKFYPNSYEGLLQLIRRLRGRDGCPWDRAQTHESLKNLFLEECYELIEAIESGDSRNLVEELGDVLFHITFQIHIGHETDELTEGLVFQVLIDKLIRRHPHVFGDVEVTDASEVEAKWDAIKLEENASTSASILSGVPRNMPSLSYAQTIQKRAASTGFDWDDFHGVLDKISEEVEELKSAQSMNQKKQELGDLLFSIVNTARWLKIDAEEALRHANTRFYQRFSTMEKIAGATDLSLVDLAMDQKQALWEDAKRLLKSPDGAES